MRIRTMSVAMMVLLIGTGCNGPPDERLQQLSAQSLERQAEQNQVIARQSDQLAESSQQYLEAEQQSRQEVIQLQRELVDRDAQSRTELTELAHNTQADHAAQQKRLDVQRHELADEGRLIAEQRLRHSAAAAVLSLVGILIACLLPLLLAGYVIHVASRPVDEEILVGDMLVQQLHEAQPPGIGGRQNPEALPDGRDEPRSDLLPNQ